MQTKDSKKTDEPGAMVTRETIKSLKLVEMTAKRPRIALEWRKRIIFISKSFPEEEVRWNKFIAAAAAAAAASHIMRDIILSKWNL